MFRFLDLFELLRPGTGAVAKGNSVFLAQACTASCSLWALRSSVASSCTEFQTELKGTAMSGPASHLDLATYLNQLRIPLDDPSLEPELDDKDEKKDKEMRYVWSSTLPG